MANRHVTAYTYRVTSGPNALFTNPRPVFLKSAKRLQSHRRGFRASPRHLFLDECISSTHTLITGLHTVTGLPWAASLPLTAVLIRLTIIGPIAAYGQVISTRRNDIFPLLYAWRATITKNVMRSHMAEGPVACQKIIEKKSREKGVEIRRRMGLQYWKSSLNWVQLPVFLVVIETIRKMCDTRDGLLGLIMKAPKSDTDSESAEGAQAFVSPYFEQSLSTEGILWFPDLLVPDPALILPFALSATLFSNLFYYDSKAKAAGLPRGKWQIRLQRTLKPMALAIGPATLGMPSGMHIYWLSSSLCALIQNIFLDWYIPGKPIIHPCKPKKPSTSLHISDKDEDSITIVKGSKS